MTSTANKEMGKVTTTITVTNHVDRILAERGFIPIEQVRSVTLNDVIVDTGASDLCLPEAIIEQLGLVLVQEISVKTAAGLKTTCIYKEVTLSVEGREGTFNCLALPGGENALLGYIPLEQLGLEPDLNNRRLKVLPEQGKDTHFLMY